MFIVTAKTTSTIAAVSVAGIKTIKDRLSISQSKKDDLGPEGAADTNWGSR